jgi:ribosome recycling factor
MPPLTEERRKEFVKKAKEMVEHAKVTVRNIRRDSNENIKKLKAEVADDDSKKTAEKNIQDLTDKYIAIVEKHLEMKEKEIMTV